MGQSVDGHGAAWSTRIEVALSPLILIFETGWSWFPLRQN